MDQQNQAQAGQQDGGTATATAPGQDVQIQPFTLTNEDALSLQSYRSAAYGQQGDNALSVLLVGRAGWSARQVQDLTGISQESVAAACQAWRTAEPANRMAAIRALPSVRYARSST